MAADLMQIIIAALNEDDAVICHDKGEGGVLYVDMVGSRSFVVTVEED